MFRHLTDFIRESVRILFCNNMKQEMNRLNINILGECEIRWENNKDFFSDKRRIIYRDGEKNERSRIVIEMLAA